MIFSSAMADILLDTNIVIYLLNRKPDYVSFLDTLKDKHFGISVISYMEVLIGAHNESDKAAFEAFLVQTEIIPLDSMIARKSAGWLQASAQKSLRNPSLADVVIGHTAIALGIPLATNNPKDFQSFRGLKILTPKL